MQKQQPNSKIKAQYRFPQQSAQHEATWLQWPHHHQYGLKHPKKLDPIWIDLAREISTSEEVRIIVYDGVELERVTQLLPEKVLENVKFFVHQNDDVWVRDNGPIFVKYCQFGKLCIENWGFNGWGKKAAYKKCNQIPTLVAQDLDLPCIDLTKTMIVEGGSIQIDGKGTLLATQSSILNKNRNPQMSKEQAEQIFNRYLDIKKVIWLKGVKGKDITDQHIDGFARFLNQETLLTMSKQDLQYWYVQQHDIERLYTCTNCQNKPFKILTLPLTKQTVKSSKGKNLEKASYINYYVCNTKIIVPNYGDPNDEVANALLRGYYPKKEIVGVKINDLYEDGGMIHCITQQQPKN